MAYRTSGIYDDELDMLSAARVMGKRTKSAMTYLSRRGVKVGVDPNGNDIRVILKAGMRGGRWYTRRAWIAEFELAVNDGMVEAAKRREAKFSHKPKLQGHNEATARFKV